MRKTNGKRYEGKGIRKSDLLLIGYLLLALGMLGRGVLEVRLLGVNTGSSEDLLHVLEQAGGMTAAATALVFEIMELCAIPIFAVLTVDGFVRSSNVMQYILRVGAVALISEVPYNYTFSGKLLDPTSRNPVFGILLCLLMLYLYRQYEGDSLQKRLVRFVAAAAAILWASMFRIDFGVMMVLVVDILWMFRGRPALREFLAAALLLCCCVTNPLVMYAPFGFLISHWYRGEKGFMPRGLQYGMYPLLLVLSGIAGVLLF